MTRQEHLLVILTEECAEVIKEADKALRFGLKDHDPHGDRTINNADLITAEFYDIIAIIGMLRDEGCLKRPPVEDVLNKIETKKMKVEKYLKYSKECGTLTD